MKIAIGSDHAGFEVKERVARRLAELGHEVLDCGTHSTESVDYPDFAVAVARKVASGACERGILACGTGLGVAMAAGKVKGIRAAPVHDRFTAQMSREHNDTNVLSMGGRIVAFGLADEIVSVWLNTKFEGGRHQRRLDQISAHERK